MESDSSLYITITLRERPLESEFPDTFALFTLAAL